MCGRGERLALALAREQINGIIEVPAKARVEVDIFELQRDSQYETTDTSEQGHGGAGVRQAGLLPPSLPQPALFSSGLLCPFLHGCTASSLPEMALLSVWGGRESSSLGAALEDPRASFERQAS